MRKPLYLIATLLLLTKVGLGQLYDKTWVVGNRAAKIHFENGTELSDTFPNIAFTGRGWASICDKQGDLLFFTNGFVVYDKYGDTIPGAINLCDSLYMEYWETGISKYNSILVIPVTDSRYYIIHYSVSDGMMSNPYASDRLYYAEVYADANNNVALITKKGILYNQNLGDSHLTSCRHANGRDWWLITNKFQSNEYLKYLVTPSGISGPYVQAIGTAYAEPEFYGQIAFSPDGSKFAGVSGNSKLNIFDFDRCTGDFSNAQSLTIPVDTISYNPLDVYGLGGITVCFSPSSQFLYLGFLKVFYQYNLQAADIAAERKTIWKWKPTDSPHLTFESFLTPTGKILIGNGYGGSGFNEIIYPDLEDTACQFMDSALYVKTANHKYINTTFNLRLGALTGSACDTIINDVNEVNAEKGYIKLSPNPAKHKLEISLYKYLPNAQLLIADELGRVMYENHHYYLDEYLDISQWQSGVYFVKIYNAEKALTAKFVKE